MNTASAKTPPLTRATYLFDGGNRTRFPAQNPRVYTVVSLLEAHREVFPARLLPKARPANQNVSPAPDHNSDFSR